MGLFPNRSRTAVGLNGRYTLGDNGGVSGEFFVFRSDGFKWKRGNLGEGGGLVGDGIAE